MKEYLDTDRVNYLIWRYLLESNYRETAAKLQKEWNVQQPHRQFDFSTHVKTHALVSTLNHGLTYDVLDRQVRNGAKTQVPRDAVETAEALQFGIFGPITKRPTQQQQQQQQQQQIDLKNNSNSGTVQHQPQQQQLQQQSSSHQDGEARRMSIVPIVQPPTAALPAPPMVESVDDFELARKRQTEEQSHLTNGHPPKKPRLSHGPENVADTTSTPMDIDQQQSHQIDVVNQQAYPSPQEGERVLTPMLRTDGPEQSTQIDKVDELTSHTTFLSLARDATSPTTMNGYSTANPLVLHCEWHPTEASMLAGSGTDGLARVWTIARSVASLSSGAMETDVNPPFLEILPEGLLPQTTATAMAWSGDGRTIAIATEQGSGATIYYSCDGQVVDDVQFAEAPILKLQFNPLNNFLLAISPSHTRPVVTVLPNIQAEPLTYVLEDYDLSTDTVDAAWVSETELVVGGGSKMRLLRCAEDGIRAVRDFDTRPGDSISEVHFNGRTSPSLFAAASEKGFIDIWDEQGQRRSIAAHDGPITSMQWQPSGTVASDDTLLIASGGDDGLIAIWNVKDMGSKPRFSFTMGGEPVVALAFTPDGAFIAGATTHKILIWKVGDYAVPRAVWNRPPHPGWLSPGIEQEEEDTCCLKWDAAGQKLAFGINNRLAVIDFR